VKSSHSLSRASSSPWEVRTFYDLDISSACEEADIDYGECVMDASCSEIRDRVAVCNDEADAFNEACRDEIDEMNS
jgi:hypothetical protein